MTNIQRLPTEVLVIILAGALHNDSFLRGKKGGLRMIRRPGRTGKGSRMACTTLTSLLLVSKVWLPTTCLNHVFGSSVPSRLLFEKSHQIHYKALIDNPYKHLQEVGHVTRLALATMWQNREAAISEHILFLAHEALRHMTSAAGPCNIRQHLWRFRQFWATDLPRPWRMPIRAPSTWHVCITSEETTPVRMTYSVHTMTEELVTEPESCTSWPVLAKAKMDLMGRQITIEARACNTESYEWNVIGDQDDDEDELFDMIRQHCTME